MAIQPHLRIPPGCPPPKPHNPASAASSGGSANGHNLHPIEAPDALDTLIVFGLTNDSPAFLRDTLLPKLLSGEVSVANLKAPVP